MDTDYTFVAWIDESGCDGDNFGKGSSEFLILTGVVGYEANSGDIDGVLNIMHTLTGKRPVKFARANDTAKYGLCRLFTSIDFYAVHVIIHKPSIKSEALRKDRNRLYSYGSKLLLERISWLCDTLEHPHAPGSGACRIVFSQDLSRSYDAFRDYVTKLARDPKRHNTRIKWNRISPTLIESVPAKTESGLLLADYHASAVGVALESRLFGQCDHRFAELLGSNILTGDNGALGLGYKLFPQEAEPLYHSDSRFTWMKRVE